MSVREQPAASPDGESVDVHIEHSGIVSRFHLPDRRTDHIQQYMFESRVFYEQEMLEQAAVFLQRGELVLDVGAYIGTHTVFFANVCGARVVAFEPNPASFATLRANVALNDLSDRVALHAVGVGAEPGRATLRSRSDHNAGMTQLDLGPGSIEMVRLDDLPLDGAPRLIKIDVEGLELEVLRGARELLERHQPILFVECATRPAFARVFELLAPLGYGQAGQFNATPTALFLPARDRLVVLNQQIADLQYAVQDRLRSIHARVERGDRALHDELVALARETTDARARIGKLHDAVGPVGEGVREINRKIAGLDAALGQINQSLGRLADGQRALEQRLAEQAKSARPALARAAESYRRLRQDPRKALAESSLVGVLDTLTKSGPPRTRLLARYTRKALLDPKKFLKDARSPLLHRHALAAYEKLERPTAPETLEAEVGPPTTSVLVAIDGPRAPRAAQLRRLADTLDLTAELLLFVAPALAHEVPRLLKEIRHSRCRAFVFDDTAHPRLLDYAADLAYGTSLVVVPEPGRASARALRRALRSAIKLPPDGVAVRSDIAVLGRQAAPTSAAASILDRFRVTTGAGKRGLFCAHPDDMTRTLERLHRAHAAFDECVVLGAGLKKVKEYVEGHPSVEVGGVRYVDLGKLPWFVYPAAAVDGPFLDRETDSAGVVCFERWPSWFHGVAAQVGRCPSTVSVVMTVFNGAQTLWTAARSILEQSYRNLELIIVDDCSTDASLAVAQQIAACDARVRVLQTPRNSGTYYAKNLGLTAATGKLVTFQDADDVSLASRLALQVGGLLSSERAIATVMRYHRRDHDGRAVWFGKWKDRTAPITLMFRREPVLQAAGYFDSVRFGADHEFIERIKIATGRRVLRIPSVGYFALQAEGSLTTSGSGAFSSGPTPTISPIRTAYWEAAQAWQAQLKENEASPYVAFPLRERPFPIPPACAPDAALGVDRVTASMATIPERISALARTVVTLLPQVDRLNVYLNGFPSVPSFLLHPKVRVARSQEHGDLKDNGKFFFLDDLEPGYHFTVDDDIEYPPDYVQQTILTIERYDRKAVVGVHGVNLAKPLLRFTRDRQVFHFKQPLDTDRFTQLLGTGTVAYHTSTLKLALGEFRTMGVADLWFAIQARRQGVALVCQARPAGWLKAIPVDGETIHQQTRRDDTEQTAIALEHGPWTAEAMAEVQRPLAESLLASGRLAAGRVRGHDVNRLAAVLGVEPIRFSVVIPGWNCADEVGACWRSLAEQAPGHYELDCYFIDDGSVDGTWDVLQMLPKSAHVHLLRNEDNLGPAYSRYRVLQEIRDPQRVCVLLDMDDLLEPTALARLAEAYLANPACWLTSGNWHNQKRQRNPLGFYTPTQLRERGYRDAALFRCAPVRSFRRFLADVVRPEDFQYPPGTWLGCCTDVALMFPLLEQCQPENITYVREPLYIYNERRDSGTLGRFGKARKVEVYRWLAAQPRQEPRGALC